MAGPPGFEPGMTGSKPAALPLGYGPILRNYNTIFGTIMAGPPGFEPGMTGSKPAALPLGYGPVN